MNADAGSRIRVVLNGEDRELDAGLTVTALVVRLGRDPRTVAVEYNGEILPRARYGSTQIDQGDRIEIVHFVQGGSPRRSAAGVERVAAPPGLDSALSPNAKCV